MQLQQEDLIAGTTQCEDLIVLTEQYGTMQSQCLDLIAGTEQCEDLH